MRPVLRLLLLLCCTILLIGLAVAGWRAFSSRTATLRVAVVSLESDEARLIGALNRWLQGKSSRYRLRPVTVPNGRAGMDAVVSRQADLAFARADEAWPPGVASGLVMYRSKIVVLALPRSGVSRLAQLQDKTIGLVGGASAQDGLLATLQRLHGVSQIRAVVLADSDIETAISRNTVQALAYIGTLPGGVLPHERLMRFIRSPQGRNMTLLGLADGEAATAQDRRYDSHDIAAASLRAQPALPDETTSTLAVAHHLVMRRSTPGLFVSRFIGEMLDAKRGILAATPLAAQMDAPDEEANAAAPVHPGASAYFNDEDQSLADLISEWGYLALVALGALGSALVWLANRLWPHAPRDEAGQLIAAFLALRREVAAGSPAGADARYEELMGRLEADLSLGRISADEVATILSAAELIPAKGLGEGEKG